MADYFKKVSLKNNKHVLLYFTRVLGDRFSV